MLESIGSAPLQQTQKAVDLVARPGVTIYMLADCIEELAALIASLPENRSEEIVEAAEILIKYRGYIEREQANVEKLHRLENVKIPNNIDYSTVTALSTEARQKLEKQRPSTLGQASRIPGVSPSDVNILLLLMNR